MLYIVLILVLAALAGVVTALITANSLWAWISIGLSVLAGIVLFVDWMRRRSATPAALDEPVAAEQADKAGTAEKAEDTEDREVVATEAADTSKDGTEASPATESVEPATKDTASTAMLPATGELGTDDPADGAADADEGTTSDDVDTAPAARLDAIPGEEETDAADLLIVSELDVEVVVVDEYPRYHLTDCGWLADRDTIPIEVAEARELGFTPCARCGPDAILAAAHRRKGKSRADR